MKSAIHWFLGGRRSFPHRGAQDGFTLTEAVIAVMLTGIGLGASFTLSLQALHYVDSTREATGATLAVQERVEQLRNTNWRNILDVNYLTGTFFARPLRSSSALQPYSEELRVWRYSYASGETLGQEVETEASTEIGETGVATSPLIHIVKAGSNISVVSSSTDLPQSGLLRVDLAVTWTGAGGRVHTRESSTIVALGGILRVNLGNEFPIGGDTGDTGTGDTGTGDTGTGDTGTGDTGTGDTGTGDTGTGDTGTGDTTEPGNNGNGNGRGNVSGKNGKK